MGKIKVVGFFHICMINNYLDIVKDQIELIVKSELYDRIDNLYIGCLGKKNELINLLALIAPYDKISVEAYNHDILKYEFFTLDILHFESQNSDKFYGFYIHTKGCSYPGNEGGKYWLDYMNYYNLTHWKEAVKNLDVGYYTYGVKLIPSSNPPVFNMHYSGNFFWFNSEYTATLDNIESLDNKNRYNAETWICSGQPLAATGCQLFVDYNTEGVFEPYKNVDNV